MGRDRAFLIAPVGTLTFGVPTVPSRQLALDDRSGLMQLLISASAREGDNAAETVHEATAKVSVLLRGEIGQIWAKGSRGIYDASNAPVAAVVCTLWGGMPIIAYLLTAPGCRERGYASSLVREIAYLADVHGYSSVGILVPPESTSIKLLNELGFEELVAPEGL